jgi:hypothetical protein
MKCKLPFLFVVQVFCAYVLFGSVIAPIVFAQCSESPEPFTLNQTIKDIVQKSSDDVILYNRLYYETYVERAFFCSSILRSSEKFDAIDPVRASQYREYGLKIADSFVAEKDMNQDGTTGWGWDEEWDAGWIVRPAHTEYAVQTPLGAYCLLDAYELSGNTTYLDTAREAMATFWDLGTFDVLDCPDCYYFPYSAYIGDAMYIKNTNALMGIFAARLCEITGQSHYCVRASQILNAEIWEIETKNNFLYVGSPSPRQGPGYYNPPDDHLAWEMWAIDEMGHALKRNDYFSAINMLSQKYWNVSFCDPQACNNRPQDNMGAKIACTLAHHGGINLEKCAESLNHYSSLDTHIWDKAGFGFANYLLTSPINLSANPLVINPGDVTSVSWDNVAAPTVLDWIGLYENDFQKDWKYTSSCSKTAGILAKAAGSCNFNLITAGNYTLKMYPNNVFSPLLGCTSFSVASENNAPVLDPIGNKQIDEGQTLTFTVSATDSDGDALTYIANNLPSGAEFNPITKTFSWTPGFQSSGNYQNILFVVDDGVNQDSESITMTVEIPGQNQNPDINNDGMVDVLDILIVVNYFNQNSDVNPRVDLNNDGIINVLDILVIVNNWGGVHYPRLIREAIKIGDMYNCPLEKPNAYFIAGNIGYSFVDDEMIYAYARLLNEKRCHKGSEKYIIFYVSNVNFPSDGIPSGTGLDVEQDWLDYWDYNAKRFSQLGYKIIINPFPFIINDNIQNIDYPPGLRPLIKSDLNLNQNEIPVVYECTDGRKVTIASIFDPKTMNMGIKFYAGIKNHFTSYPEFVKISIVPPSDFGEYGFPFGVPTRWWEGSDSVGDCYLNGDIYAPSTPTYQNYNQKLIDFRNLLTPSVKTMFPNKDYMIYLGYGDDSNPRHGFSYQEAVDFAAQNNIDVHSSHAIGIDPMEVPLSKIVSNKPENHEFTFENAGDLNELTMTKVLFHASKYEVTGLEPYPFYLYDDFYLSHLTYSLGPSSNINMYSDKGVYFDVKNDLGALRSTHVAEGFIDAPKNGDTINGDVINNIFGWGYFEDPYGDRQNYGVKVYAGHLIENSPYYVDRDKSNGKHPEYMRLVGETITNFERASGLGDLSRFGLSWKPNLATGKAVLRIFLINWDSQIMAEHPNSPLIINVNSRITGSANLIRTNYNYNTNDVCSRTFEMNGIASDIQKPSQNLDIVILDEYRGKILAQGTTDSSGNFNIPFTVDNSFGEETQVITPRAYVDTGDDLIALQTNLGSNVGGNPNLIVKFKNTVVDCDFVD